MKIPFEREQAVPVRQQRVDAEFPEEIAVRVFHDDDVLLFPCKTGAHEQRTVLVQFPIDEFERIGSLLPGEIELSSVRHCAESRNHGDPDSFGRRESRLFIARADADLRNFIGPNGEGGTHRSTGRSGSFYFPLPRTDG